MRAGFVVAFLPCVRFVLFGYSVRLPNRRGVSTNDNIPVKALRSCVMCSFSRNVHYLARKNQAKRETWSKNTVSHFLQCHLSGNFVQL